MVRLLDRPRTGARSVGTGRAKRGCAGRAKASAPSYGPTWIEAARFKSSSAPNAKPRAPPYRQAAYCTELWTLCRRRSLLAVGNGLKLADKVSFPERHAIVSKNCVGDGQMEIEIGHDHVSGVGFRGKPLTPIEENRHYRDHSAMQHF